MADIFENIVVCKNCGKEMRKVFIVKNGFKMRGWQCYKCKQQIIHPKDLEDYKKFKELKKKEYEVKLRIVGNSYAVSIPKEIINFIKEQEKIINDMVKLCFEDTKKILLIFD